MDDRMAIGKVLESMRKRVGLTQRDAATKAGFRSQGTIAQYESGERHITVEKLLRILDAYQIKFDLFAFELGIVRDDLLNNS